MIFRGLRFISILSVVALVLFAGIPGQAGTFKDRDGSAHVWSVDAGFVLTWDGAPYVPFGFVFNPKYLSDGQTDENITTDKASLSALKSAGITDILLRPGKGISSSPAEAFQRVIDALEEQGFRYGIQLVDPQRTPFAGYVIEPSVNRIDNILSSGDMTRNMPDSRFALYALADAKTGTLKSTGRVAPANGSVTVPVMLRTNVAHVLLLYPMKDKPTSVEDPNFNDIWSDYDRFRDVAVSYLTQIKFGKGLRFFADPFGDAIGMQGEVLDMVPVSSAFRLEYAAWLTKKYGAPHGLTQSWGVQDHEVSSFAEASGYIPLWNQNRGIKYVYDDANVRRYEIATEKSTIWADFIAFRDSSIKAYLDAFADVTKRQVADVPVVHTVNGLNSIFQGTANPGYDGLSVPALDGDDLMLRAGTTLSLAENSVRRPWLISKVTPSASGFAQKDALFGALNTVYNLGAKGFFMDAVPSAESQLLAWFGEYASISRRDSSLAIYTPRVVYYQAAAGKAEIKKLPGGAWWIPTLAPGRNLYLGPNLAGYTLDASVGSGSGIYVWSLKGRQLIHNAARNSVTVVKASGETITLAPNKKGSVEIEVGADPVIVRGIIPEEFMPIEVVRDAMKDLQETIAKANEKRMDTDAYVEALRNAKSIMDKGGNLLTALQMCQEASADLKHRLLGLAGANPADMGATATSGGAETKK